MKLIARQKIWLAVVIVTNLLLWIIPSDVVELIARDRQTLLGRYSREHFTWILAVGLISMVSFYIDWSVGETYKRRWLQVIATLALLLPLLFVVDFLLRDPVGDHYVRESVAYHRPVDIDLEIVFEDRPTAYRSYPNAVDGYGRTICSLHTDHRGYRNSTQLDQYDVVVLGDSFAEGSSVSDAQTWPHLLEELSGLSVYNLGMSGYDPMHYRAALETHGLALSPRYVICLLYEGNDFRSAKTDRKRLKPSFSKRVKRYFKQSPIIQSIDRAMITRLGPINSDGPVSGAEVLDWLPLGIPQGPSAKHYAFAPKQLRDLFEGRSAFAQDEHWLNPRRQIDEMRTLCRRAGAQFILAFAPTKAHVTLPMAADRLDAAKVRGFLALRYKKKLPASTVFLAALVERAGAREQVVSEWCARESIPFVALTPSLRRSTGGGVQTYYTYDQHWTPEGHQVVAETIAAFLAEEIGRAEQTARND